MSTFKLDINAGGDYAPVFTHDLQGISIRTAFRWLPIINRWIVYFRDPVDVLLGWPHIVSPGADIYLDIRDKRIPPGRFGFSGPDPYVREDLGTRLNLYYVEST